MSNKAVSLLMIVATSNDVFIYNMAKWLKSSMCINIDVIESRDSLSSNQGCGREYYNNVYTLNKGFLYRIPYLGYYLAPLLDYYQLKKKLKRKHYDIIHCQRVMSFVVFSSFLRKHCYKLYVTFWGGELDNDKLFLSQKYFVKKIGAFLHSGIDGIVNSEVFFLNLIIKFPRLEVPFYKGILGSPILEVLYSLMKVESKEVAKTKLRISSSKNTLLIGYSGKPIHNHIGIIKELMKHNELAHKFHILVPMTRGYDYEYADAVEELLVQSGYNFSLFKDQFFSDEAMARVRLATDFVFQYSEYDGFSRSIVECICAKALVIYGTWLNYEGYLKVDRLFAIPSESIESGVKFLASCNYSDYIKILEENSEHCRYHLWSSCIKDWVNLYNRTAVPLAIE